VTSIGCQKNILPAGNNSKLVDCNWLTELIFSTEFKAQCVEVEFVLAEVELDGLIF